MNGIDTDVLCFQLTSNLPRLQSRFESARSTNSFSYLANRFQAHPVVTRFKTGEAFSAASKTHRSTASYTDLIATSICLTSLHFFKLVCLHFSRGLGESTVVLSQPSSPAVVGRSSPIRLMCPDSIP